MNASHRKELNREMTKKSGTSKNISFNGKTIKLEVDENNSKNLKSSKHESNSNPSGRLNKLNMRKSKIIHDSPTTDNIDGNNINKNSKKNNENSFQPKNEELKNITISQAI